MAQLPYFMDDMELLDIPLSQIEVSTFIYRRKINKNYVQEIIESNSIDTLPPIIVFRIETKRGQNPRYDLVDGQHRLAVFHHFKRTSIKAHLLKTDSPYNALIASINANNSHGMRFSNGEKKRIALILHKEHTSEASIAATLQVSRSTVYRWIYPTGKQSNDNAVPDFELACCKAIKNISKSLLTLRKEGFFLSKDIASPNKKDIDYLNDLVADEITQIKNKDENTFIDILCTSAYFLKALKQVAD